MSRRQERSYAVRSRYIQCGEGSWALRVVRGYQLLVARLAGTAFGSCRQLSIDVSSWKDVPFFTTFAPVIVGVVHLSSQNWRKYRTGRSCGMTRSVSTRSLRPRRRLWMWMLAKDRLVRERKKAKELMQWMWRALVCVCMLWMSEWLHVQHAFSWLVSAESTSGVTSSPWVRARVSASDRF